MAATGRPSDYTEETAQIICTRIAEGEPLTKICKGDEMPSLASVYRWLDARAEFRDKYARAREDAADTLADEIISIADEAEVEATYEGEQMRFSLDGAAIARNRLRVDARKWVASKLKPKKYGDRVAQEITGADGGPIQHTHTVGFESAAEDLLSKIRSGGN